MSRRLKLWILRRPAIAILMLLLIASVVTGEIAWRRHASAAASAQARADAEIEWREEKTQLLRNLRDKMTSTMVDDRAISAEMMAGLWVMEFISGNKLFDIEGEHDAIWATRVEYIERHTGTARAEGRGEHIETLLWQTALSLWYIRDGRYDEADAMLLRTRVSMDTKLEVGDVWLENIAILERVSHARRTLDAWPAQREELSARIDELARDSSGLDQRAPRSPLDRLVLDVLLQACDAQHLDQRVRYDTAYARLKAIRDNM